MNISQAIQQIISAVRACTAVDERGQLLIPKSSQRPILLYGPPGIGKTYAVREAADALGIGFLSYTMTHHTRQSALGLPQIVQHTFNDHDYAVTQYTMSEIMRDVYEAAYDQGLDRGILFLDEINCVSETLMPAMLELLQFKRFGHHALPDGWIIVCAGNPEDYNRSARGFDSVTLDRVRLIRVEPDIGSYLDYASAHGVHPTVLSYLRLRPDELSLYEPEGSVTPRSWTDLSMAISAAVHIGDTPSPALFEQFLQIPRICNSFASYYAACVSSNADAVIESILNGTDSCFASISRASFDLRVYITTVLADHLARLVADFSARSRLNDRIGYFLSGIDCNESSDFRKACEEHLARLEKSFSVRLNAGIMRADDIKNESILFESIRSALCTSDPRAVLDRSARIDSDDLIIRRDQLDTRINNALQFADNALHDSALRVIFVTAIRSSAAAAYLRSHPNINWDNLCSSADIKARSARLKEQL